MRLDDVADAEGVDVDVESAGKTSGAAFAAEFAGGVGVHGVDVVVFFEGECVVWWTDGVLLLDTAPPKTVWEMEGRKEDGGGVQSTSPCAKQTPYVVSELAITIFLIPSLHAASITLYVLCTFPMKHSLSGTSMFRAYAAKWITASGFSTRGPAYSPMSKSEERALKTWPLSVRSVFRV